MKREGRACRVRSLQLAQIPVSREAGGRAMDPRRLGAWRWSEDPRRKFFTFGNQSRRDAENAEEPGAPSRGEPVDVPGRSKLRPSRRRGTM